MAVGARRQFEQAGAGETRDLAYSPTLTSQSLEPLATGDLAYADASQQTFAVMAMAAATNSAPVVPAQPVGRSDAVTGVVTGTVIATDPDGNTLAYTLAGDPASGTVTIDDETTGTYTYTPTQAARLDAYTTSGLDTDTFTVAVSDGQQTVTAPVPVNIKPARYENQAPTAVGTSPSGVVVSPDGTRMFVANTGSGTVSVINASTGQLIDTNRSTSKVDSINVGSSPSALALSAPSPDGTQRLYVTNTGSNTVSVIRINTSTDTYQRIDANPSSSSMDIAVGSSPSALAFSPDGTRLYVANRNSNTVSVIGTDPANTATYNRLIDANPNLTGIQSISVGSSPSALAVSPITGQVYVANRSSNTISVISNTNNTYSVVKTITVGSEPSSLAFTPDRSRLYAVNTGSATVSVIGTDPTNSSTYNQLIDANPNLSGIQSISVGSSPSSVVFTPDGSLAYVANGNDTVSVVKTADYTVFATVTIDPNAETTGGHVVALSPDGTRIYVTDAVDRTVRVLGLIPVNYNAPVVGGDTIPNGADPVTGVVTGEMNVDDPDRDRLTYTLAEPPAKGGTVTFDQQTGAFSYTPSQAARDQAAATSELDEDTFGVFVSDGIATTHTSVRVQVAPTPSPTAPFTNVLVTVGSGPSGAAVSGNYTYVINYDSNNVTVIDTATNQFVKTIDVGAGPLSVAASPQRNRVYVSNSLSNSVSVIDTTTNTLVDTDPSTTAIDPITIPVLPGYFNDPEVYVQPVEYPNRVTEVAASGNRLYVNATDGRITVVDTTNDTNTIIRTASVGTFSDLKVSPNGTRLYGTGGTGLTVIDTATMTPVGVNVGPAWDLDSFRSEFTNSVGNVAVSPDGKRAYVTYGVTVVERGVGGQNGFFIEDALHRPWLVTGGYGAVSVIDTQPGSVNYNKEIARIVVPLGVQDVAVSPDSTRLYVTSGDGKTVTVVNTANNAIVGTFTTDQTSSGGRAIDYYLDDWYYLYSVAAFTRYITVGQNGTLYITDYTDGTAYAVTVGDPTML